MHIIEPVELEWFIRNLQGMQSQRWWWWWYVWRVSTWENCNLIDWFECCSARQATTHFQSSNWSWAAVSRVWKCWRVGRESERMRLLMPQQMLCEIWIVYIHNFRLTFLSSSSLSKCAFEIAFNASLIRQQSYFIWYKIADYRCRWQIIAGKSIHNKPPPMPWTSMIVNRVATCHRVCWSHSNLLNWFDMKVWLVVCEASGENCELNRTRLNCNLVSMMNEWIPERAKVGVELVGVFSRSQHDAASRCEEDISFF